MKLLVAFILGFVLAAVLFVICNAATIRAVRKRRKQELEKHPEKKLSATKVIIFSVLATYYVAFGVGVWVVIAKDYNHIGTLLTFVGGVSAFAVAFYCWKSKAENLLKIKAAYPELQGMLSDFSGMSSQ